MAAVLATRGIASHRTAAAIWEIWSSDHIEITAPTAKRHPGIRAHRAALPRDEITVERGIPVTTVARTLLDLAAVVPSRHLERALNEAEIRRLGGALSVWELIDRYPTRPGTAALREIFAGRSGITSSELEARFLEFVRRRKLPVPATNFSVQVQADWIECDCVWPRQRVIVELDGRLFHSTAAAFERDRARDRRLTAAGWTVIRVTWRQLSTEPDAVAADLRALLARRS